MIRKYEHKIEEWRGFDINELEDRLNKLSQSGWELVCVVEERHYFRRDLTVRIGGWPLNCISE